MTFYNPPFPYRFHRIPAGLLLSACTLFSLFTAAGCSSADIDTAAGKPSAEAEAAVSQLNDNGAEIVLDSEGEVVAVKLPEKTTPEVIATLASLTKLKRVDATETTLKQPAFADLKSQRPEVEIELPY
tara:strand:- start:957 stop:1340 length:384 start_codon:yes stop_codon:yes gene_type:complete